MTADVEQLHHPQRQAMEARARHGRLSRGYRILWAYLAIYR